MTCIVQMAESLRSPTNWNDHVQVPVTNLVTSHRFFDPNPPPGMSFIPAGSFTMGDAFSEADSSERPTHKVHVSAFYMDKYEVTKALWDEVYQWAITNGYSFDFAGTGKAANHPVYAVNWFDTVKWCNARSEKEGKTPAFYNSTNQTTIYRTGQVVVLNTWVKWNAGYRLPTEAEWEKAARGGLSGKRFPWGNTITHTQANYFSYDSTTIAFDVSSTHGYHPTYNDFAVPYTSPVSSFAANGYGLYDMAGNMWEWCWDNYSYSYYGTSPANDPQGPAPTSRSYRVLRGGSWNYDAWDSRTTFRNASEPTGGNPGFRSVLPPSQ